MIFTQDHRLYQLLKILQFDGGRIDVRFSVGGVLSQLSLPFLVAADQMPLIDPPSDLICYISRELFADPVVAADGHSYSRRSIENWFTQCDEQHKLVTSPITHQPLANRTLNPNLYLNRHIAQFQQQLISPDQFCAAVKNGDLKTLESANIVRSLMFKPIAHIEEPVRAAPTAPTTAAAAAASASAGTPAPSAAAAPVPQTTAAAAAATGSASAGSSISTAPAPAPAAKQPEMYTPLALAVRFDRVSVVKWFVSQITEVDTRNANGEFTPLHVACRYSPASVQLLLDAKADVNAVSKTFMTPLHYAAQRQPSVIPLLLARGANPKAMTEKGTLPMHLIFNNLEAVKHLVAAAGKDSLFARTSAGRSVLMYIIELSGHDSKATIHYLQQLMTFMLETGGKEQLLSAFHNQRGHTLMHSACLFALPAILEFLLSLPYTATGSPPNAVASPANAALRADDKDANGHTPLHALVSCGVRTKPEDALAIIRLLLESGTGCDINAQVAKTTCLHRLIQRVVVEPKFFALGVGMIFSFLRYGARTDIPNGAGKTCAQLLESYPNLLTAVLRAAMNHIASADQEKGEFKTNVGEIRGRDSKSDAPASPTAAAGGGGDAHSGTGSAALAFLSSIGGSGASPKHTPNGGDHKSDSNKRPNESSSGGSGSTSSDADRPQKRVRTSGIGADGTIPCPKCGTAVNWSASKACPSCGLSAPISSVAVAPSGKQ